jgi:F-type H+-transporting ATPase subunit delta
MRNNILASRYAKAVYSQAKETNEQDAIFNEMRALDQSFSSDKDINEYLSTPLVRPTDKVKALEGMLSKIKVSGTLKNFLLLLAKKDRLGLYHDIVNAYEVIADEAHGVTRGSVRSATVLGPEDRKRIEQLVSKATKKQVILTYKEDPQLVGGLVAEVGSFTFDDSITSHLKRINEQLTRSFN